MGPTEDQCLHRTGNKKESRKNIFFKDLVPMQGLQLEAKIRSNGYNYKGS